MAVSPIARGGGRSPVIMVLAHPGLLVVLVSRGLARPRLLVARVMSVRGVISPVIIIAAHPGLLVAASLSVAWVLCVAGVLPIAGVLAVALVPVALILPAARVPVARVLPIAVAVLLIRMVAAGQDRPTMLVHRRPLAVPTVGVSLRLVLPEALMILRLKRPMPLGQGIYRG